MYYELYLDVFFLENFLMDYILLLLVKKMLLCTATHRNICFGAFMGSFLTCLIVVLPIPYVFIKFMLFHMFVNTCMIRAGLKIKTRTHFARALVLFYVGSFLLGGVLQAVRNYLRVGSLFFVIAVAVYCGVEKLWDILVTMQQITLYQCEVDLYFHESCMTVKGLIDTGNLLCDPISGEPVHVLNRKEAGQFFEKEPVTKIRYIPYHSVGKNEGTLLAIPIDRMRVRGNEEYWVKTPLIGISEEAVSFEGDYKMILNPKAF